MVPSVEYIIAVLSVLRCGEAFMPLDPSWPKERILSIVSSSNVDLIIGCRSSFDTSSHFKLDKSHWLVDCNSCPVLSMSMEDKLQNHSDPSELVWPCEKEELRLFCYLMYTSGSTGKPKGICGTEKGLLNRFLWMQEFYPLLGEEILLFKTSISFVDHLQEFLGAILSACTLVIPPFNELKQNPFHVIDYLKAYSVTRMTAVPSLMRVIIPALQSEENMQVQNSLKFLVLSGEILPLSLWNTLSSLLPQTSILNLYGSTEVSGDCTYFDCRRLPRILESDSLSSVPIGIPISNCNVMLVGESDTSNEGEICVNGLCVNIGYFPDPNVMPLDYSNLSHGSLCNCSINDNESQLYFRTGDFARRLQSGDLVFLGRKDRTVKINGQRIALEEIENALRGHPDVVDAAVIFRKGQGELELLEAFIILKRTNESDEVLRSCIRRWMVEKLPLVMVPNNFFFTKSFPMSATGKVDYASLAGSISMACIQDEIGGIKSNDLLEVITKAFCDALSVEKVCNDDDFFMMGGDSIAAAYVSYNLGINMRLIYNFPSPSKLQVALLKKEGSSSIDVGKDDIGSLKSDTCDLYSSKPCGTSSKPVFENNDKYLVTSKCLKVDSNTYATSKSVIPCDGCPWNSNSVPMLCSFSRCNKVMCEVESKMKNICHTTWSIEFPRNKSGFMRELWKVHMESCVDASAIVVFKDWDIYLLIGSHSHKFVCVNAKSGFIRWGIELEGRIECSAAILDDFSQVVVGCYRGIIYFLDFSNGNICWTFQTRGEVKSQPVIDKRRNLVWCGSHDHYLYALNYRDHCCVYKLPCGGSIFGSPSIDEARDILYVASTSGRVTAISLKVQPFCTLWLHELNVPVFGSLSISSNGNVICCLVDGHVLAFDSSGSIVWKGKTDGPIFAGACISHALPSQALICSRNGSVYSFELEGGDLLWECSVGDPITAAAYVDENLKLVSDSSLSSDRLVCICASSGSIHLLKISWDTTGRVHRPTEFARLKLQGDIFSSPVMIGGRIFVGCRDDYVHCIAVEAQSSLSN